MTDLSKSNENPEIIKSPEPSFKQAPPELEIIDTSDNARTAQLELRDSVIHNRNLGTIGAEMIKFLPVLVGDDDAQKAQKLSSFLNKDDPESAASLAREMLHLDEGPLFHELADKARRVFRKEENESDEDYENRIQNYIIEIKKPFFEVLASGHLNTADLNQFICGGIRFAENPPPEISHAVASITASGGEPQLTFYKPYFDKKTNPDIDHHIVKHELGHVISSQIFRDQMADLEKIAADPNASTEGLPPHLLMIIAMIRNPEIAAEREHRGEGSHLHRELMKLHQANGNNSPDVTERRRLLVREILAERVANYLESDSLESYAALRFGNVSADLSDDNPLFISEKMMFEAIDTGMKEKDNWQFGSEVRDIFWDDDIYYEPEAFNGLESVMARPGYSAGTGGAPRPKSVLEKFFAWLTKSNKE